MRSFFSKSRRSVVTGVVVSAPLVLALACSDSPSSFFDPPMGSGGKGGSSSGGSAGATGGMTSTGGTSAGKGGAGGSSGGSGGTSGSAGGSGTNASGGKPSAGAGGDGATAGSGGADPAVGGSAGTDAMGGEGGIGEGGMDGGASGTAGTGGIAGTAGTAGTAGEGDGGSSLGGTSGSAGTAGSGGVSGGTGGTSGAAGTSSGGTGGASCTPKTEICDGVDNDCGEDIDEGGVCPSGCHGGTLKGRTFLLCTFEEKLQWSEARTFCREADDGDGSVEVAGPMTLVQIVSAEENQFLVEWIAEDGIVDSVWMGANDRTAEGQWVWDRGSGAALLFFRTSPTRMAVNGAYNDWPTGQPAYDISRGCGIFDGNDDFEWDDRACTQTLESFICGEIP